MLKLNHFVGVNKMMRYLNPHTRLSDIRLRKKTRNHAFILFTDADRGGGKCWGILTHRAGTDANISKISWTTSLKLMTA